MGHLAGSVVRAYDSSQGCEFKPHTVCRDCLKKLEEKNNPKKHTQAKPNHKITKYPAIKQKPHLQTFQLFNFRKKIYLN